MAEYINRNALLESIRSGEGTNEHKIFAALCVSNAAAADVVEVVRRPVKGYEGYYEVDQFGRVYSVDRAVSVNDNGRQYKKHLEAKQMKQSIHTKGYKTVSLTKNGKAKTIFVHRIVAEAFVANENDLPMVNHKDEDKTNNFAENLEWCTASYNRTYGKAIENHAKKIRGKKHTEERKEKISVALKRHFAVAEKGKNDMARCNFCGSYVITTEDIEALRFAHKDSSYGHPDPVGEQGVEGEPGCTRCCMKCANVAPRSEVAREIFEEIESTISPMLGLEDGKEYVAILGTTFAELKKKYTESAAEK